MTKSWSLPKSTLGTMECIRLVHRAMSEGYRWPESSHTGRSAPSRDSKDPFLSPTLLIYSSLSLRTPLPFKPHKTRVESHTANWDWQLDIQVRVLGEMSAVKPPRRMRF